MEASLSSFSPSPNSSVVEFPNSISYEYHRNTSNIHGAIWAFGAVSLFLTTTTTCARIYTKFHYFGLRRTDDFLMILAYLGLICMWAFLFTSVRYGAGGQMSNINPSALLRDTDEFMKYAFLHELFYAFIQILLKTSIALQILHIFVPNPTHPANRNRKFWVIVIFIILQDLWFTCFFWVSLFQCSPVKKEFHPEMPGTCIAGRNAYNIAISAWNMASDILMLLFPMVCIFKLTMRRAYKLESSGAFFVGILAVTASLLRLVFTIRRLYTDDITIVTTQIALCDTGEITAGIVVGNFVPIPRFIREMLHKARPKSYVLSQTTSTTFNREFTQRPPQYGSSTSDMCSFQELMNSNRIERPQTI